MLDIPSRGMGHSVSTHNVALDVLGDWIEASILFQKDKEISKSDVVDLLCDEEVYAGQALAWEAVDDAWKILRTRKTSMGKGSAFVLDGSRIVRVAPWHSRPAHSFCLMLCCAKWYSPWTKQFGSDFTEQGSLFEELSGEALSSLFPGWEVHSTGWSRARTTQLKAAVTGVAEALGEAVGDIVRWTKSSAKDAGLDLMCYRPFADGRAGYPAFLFQCASGCDWDGKLHTPNLRTWTKAIQFASDPKKAFATPFAFQKIEFLQNANLVDGLLLDRLRLLSPGDNDADWVSPQLRRKLVIWLRPRVKLLPFKT